jgi:hypothetical protein
MLILARSARKSSRQAVTQRRAAWAEDGDGHVEAVLPGLVADPAAAQEIDVVRAVHEVFHRGRPVGGNAGGEAVEDAPVDAVRIVIGLEQERQSGATSTAALTGPGP